MFADLVKQLTQAYELSNFDGKRDIEAGLETQLEQIARRDVFLAMVAQKRNPLCQN